MPNLQKLKFPLLIILVLAGLGFTIFALFFNRGTLYLTAQAPYSVIIANTRIVNCPNNDCLITLAPGNYQITLTKADYRDIQESIELKLGQVYQKSFQFDLFPKIQAIGDWPANKNFSKNPALLPNLDRLNLNLTASFWINLDNSLNNFPLIQNFQISSTGENYLLDDFQQISLIKLAENTPEITPIPTGKAYFYHNDNRSVIYLADNPDTQQPTLYTLDLLGNRPFVPKTITTFLRKISSYQLIPNQTFTKIALLDQSNPEQVGLYIIDLKEKTRKLITSAPNLLAFQWLESNFIQDSGLSTASVSQTAKIRNSVKTTAPTLLEKTTSPTSQEPTALNLTDSNSFLLQKRNPVTFQTELYRGEVNQPTLELLNIVADLSSLLIIDENQIIYSKAATDNSTGFVLEKINLVTSQTQTLFTTADLPLPKIIQYEQSQQRLLFLSGNTIYSLSLII